MRIAITFDDGPNPEYTPQILEMLKDAGVKSTFFLIGKNVEKYSGVVEKIAEGGHDCGNHTYTHFGLHHVLHERGTEAVCQEIMKSGDAISAITGKKPLFFRPPGVIWDAEIERVAGPLCGKVIVASGIDDYTWSEDSTGAAAIKVKADAIFNDTMEKAKPGAIIALHDGSEFGLPEHGEKANWGQRAIPTVRALRPIIQNLQARGFSLVKLSEMNLVEESLRD